MEQNMKNAVEQICPQSRQTFDFIEKSPSQDDINGTFAIGTFGNRRGAVIALMAHKRSNTDIAEALRTLNIDMWSTLIATVEGEAQEKLERCNQGQGL